jgi:hypothetical protein
MQMVFVVERLINSEVSNSANYIHNISSIISQYKRKISELSFQQNKLKERLKWLKTENNSSSSCEIGNVLCKLESITKEKFSLEQKTLTLSTKPLEKKVRVRKAIKTTLKTYKIAAKIVKNFS